MCEDFFSKIKVRPVSNAEKQKWRDIMAKYHYLGFSKTSGEAVLYVATVDDNWLALLSWASAALRIGVREKLIGWDDFARQKRLKFIANNTRFLVLPDVNIKNLASKILGLNIRRLSNDWENIYGHPIYLAETFVDPHYTGTCYRAAAICIYYSTRFTQN